MTEKFFIQIKNNKPYEHPIAEWNMRLLFSNFDPDNPPEGYARFIRKPLPDVAIHQKLSSVHYISDEELSKEYNTEIWTDHYEITSLSEEEIIQLAIQSVKDYNENMRKIMNAPYSAPDDGNYYIWSVSSNNWIKKPENFDELLSKYYKKIKEYGLLETRPEDLDKIDKTQLLELQNLFNELVIDK